MTKKRIIFVFLTVLAFGSLLYVGTIPDDEMPRKLRDFRPEHAWIIVASASGLILWLWSLYDWGMRKMRGTSKFVWLMILLLTAILGSIAYFILVGLRAESPNDQFQGGTHKITS